MSRLVVADGGDSFDLLLMILELLRLLLSIFLLKVRVVLCGSVLFPKLVRRSDSYVAVFVKELHGSKSLNVLLLFVWIFAIVSLSVIE